MNYVHEDIDMGNGVDVCYVMNCGGSEYNVRESYAAASLQNVGHNKLQMRFQDNWYIM